MTQAEWLACNDPHEMLKHLRGRADDRPLRLFACGCCRRLWHLLTDARSRQAVVTAERFAAGHAAVDELAAAEAAAWDVVNQLFDVLLRTDRGARQPVRAALEAAKAAAETALCRPRAGGERGLAGVSEVGGPLWAAAWVVANVAREAVRRAGDGAARASLETAEREAQAALLRQTIGNP